MSAAPRPHSHLQHDFVQDHAIHQVHVDAEVVLVATPQVPEGFHLPGEGQWGWGMAGGHSQPRQDRAALPAAPSLPAAPLCSPRSPRGSAGRAPGARRRSRPCRRGSGSGGRLRAWGRLTRETKARSPCPAALLPAGRCLQGKQCAAHRSPAPLAHAGPLAALPPPDGNRPVFPRRARLAAAVGVPQARASHAGRRGLSHQAKRPGAGSKGAELPQDGSEQHHELPTPAAGVPVAGRARAPAIRPGWRRRRREGQRPSPMGGAEGPAPANGRRPRGRDAVWGRGAPPARHRPHAAARAARGLCPPRRGRPRTPAAAPRSLCHRGDARPRQEIRPRAAPGAAVPAGSRPAPRPPPLGTAPALSGSARVRSLRFKSHEVRHKVLRRGASRRTA